MLKIYNFFLKIYKPLLLELVSSLSIESFIINENINFFLIIF